LALTDANEQAIEWVVESEQSNKVVKAIKQRKIEKSRTG